MADGGGLFTIRRWGNFVIACVCRNIFFYTICRKTWAKSLFFAQIYVLFTVAMKFWCGVFQKVKWVKKNPQFNFASQNLSIVVELLENTFYSIKSVLKLCLKELIYKFFQAWKWLYL